MIKTVRIYLDGWLLLFILLALGASLISAHGAWLFFGYLVDPWLAGVFTTVLALSIIGLDAAGTLERSAWKRAMYYGGMLLFLLMETLANYFSGEIVFAARVAEKVTRGDLLDITKTMPVATRALVVLFLALASAAVAFFTFAAATRAKTLAAGMAKRRTRLTQLRSLVRQVVRTLRKVRTDHAAALVQSAHLAHERDAAQSALAQQADALAQLTTAHAVACHDVAQRDEALVHASRERDDACATVTKQHGEMAHLGAMLAQAREYVAQRDEEMVQLQEAVAQRQLALPDETLILGTRRVSLRALSKATDTSVTTLRRKLAQIGTEEVMV